jgi:hypothetical protein
MERQHIEAVSQERDRRKLAEARNNAYEYTLKQLQIYFEDMEKAFQSLSGNISKMSHRITAGKIAIVDTLDTKQ